MATKAASPDHKIADTGEPVEPGHAEWKRGKVMRGLEQSKDRDSMIPAERVWRNFAV